ncbi:hypothetical protein EVAR_53020_1 [Eumeta japonica]|uniref:Uncharacterized protein n=1 Tax=Eumeta variegata TaxID=151549 RepID=A0A4C1XL57_EUMVA|nr:hypothetical protein EVAR_53020_1 [Eumeta japonica]
MVNTPYNGMALFWIKLPLQEEQVFLIPAPSKQILSQFSQSRPRGLNNKTFVLTRRGLGSANDLRRRRGIFRDTRLNEHSRARSE